MAAERLARSLTARGIMTGLVFFYALFSCSSLGVTRVAQDLDKKAPLPATDTRSLYQRARDSEFYSPHEPGGLSIVNGMMFKAIYLGDIDMLRKALSDGADQKTIGTVTEAATKAAITSFVN